DEVLVSAVAINLLFGLPLLAGVLITAFDVLIVLALQGRGFRLVEAFVVTLIASIAACFAYEIFFAHPLWHEAAIGFIRRAEILPNREMRYIAIGILGATVMPHNLHLHSSIVQTRAIAIIPAALVIGFAGENKVTSLLILSQVILSFQLPFAVIPLIQFTNSRARMGEFANSRLTTVVAWIVAATILFFNAELLWLIF